MSAGEKIKKLMKYTYPSPYDEHSYDSKFLNFLFQGKEHWDRHYVSDPDYRDCRCFSYNLQKEVIEYYGYEKKPFSREIENEVRKEFKLTPELEERVIEELYKKALIRIETAYVEKEKEEREKRKNLSKHSTFREQL